MANETPSFNQYKERSHALCSEAIQRIIGGETYQPKLVQNWVDSIGQDVVNRLRDLSSDFKYIVSVTIVEKKGGLVQSSTCFWDASVDCHVTVRWENQHLHCVVVLYAVAL